MYPQRHQPPIADVLQILAHGRDRHTGDATAQSIFGEERFAFNRIPNHVFTPGFVVGIEQMGPLATDGVDHFEGKFDMSAFIAEHPVGPGGQALKQAAGAEEIDVGEGGEEKHALNAAREADQIQQEILHIRFRLNGVQIVDRINPFEAEVGLCLDRRDVFDG